MDAYAYQRQSLYFFMEGRRERIVIPIHGSHPLKLGLLKSLMKIADIKEEEL